MQYCQTFSSFLIFCYYFVAKCEKLGKYFPWGTRHHTIATIYFNALLESVNLLTKINFENWIKLVNNITWLWKLHQHGIIFLPSMGISRTRTQCNSRNQNYIRNWRKRKDFVPEEVQRLVLNCHSYFCESNGTQCSRKKTAKALKMRF